MIRLIKPYLSYAEVEKEFQEIIDSGMLTRGRYASDLPKAFSEYTGSKYAFNTSSATTALSISLEVLGIRREDEVIVSDFSFPATVNVVEAIGAKPVFVDVSKDTYNMLPEELERKITPRTRAVIFVCALGNPDGLVEIERICKEKGIPLICDAACAIGSSENGRKAGSIGDISCFSFHPRKLLTAGEGGQVTTDREDLRELLTIKLMHGEKIEEGRIEFVDYGFNYRLPELQCLMILKQLPKLDQIVKNRNDLQKRYQEKLEPLGYIAQKHGSNVIHNMQSVVFTVPEFVDRDGLIAHLRKKEIESTIGTYCQSACTYYQKKYNSVQQNGWYLEKHTITLPCYEGVPVEDVCDAVAEYRR